MAKYAGRGVKLQHEDTPSSGTFTDVAQIMELEGPNQSREIIEASTHDTQDWKEFLVGLKDPGGVDLELAWDPGDTAGQKFLRDRFDDGAARTYRVVFPDAGLKTESFQAIVTSFGRTSPKNGVLTANVNLKGTGAITKVN